MDELIREYLKAIQITKDPINRMIGVVHMGDERWNRYKATGDQKEKRLAANCYLAAKVFQERARQTS